MKLKRAATQEEMLRVLEIPSWPDGLEARERYLRLHDAHGRTGQGHLIVLIGEDGMRRWI
jgi:hypothetical protein